MSPAPGLRGERQIAMLGFAAQGVFAGMVFQAVTVHFTFSTDALQRLS